MEASDLPFAFRLVKKEGWGDLEADLAREISFEPEGCFVVEEDGAPVAMVTTTAYGASGWIGNLIVEKKRRSRGHGRALMERAIEYLRSRDVETIRLDADPDGIPLYRNLGFIEEYRSLRYEGVPAREVGGTAREMATSDLDRVCRLDERVFGADRSRVLEALHRDYPGLAFALPAEGGITGYLMARPMDGGIRIGPWVVEEARGSGEAARELLGRLLGVCRGEKMRTGLPEGNSGGRRLLEELGFQEEQGCLRMRLGPPKHAEKVRAIFGIGSGAKG
jgi:GNAT superfamily N-acetyltransferase